MSPDNPFRRELQFPVKWTFRIILDAASEETTVKALQELLTSEGASAPVRERDSKRGSYVSYRAEATLVDRAMFERLPALLSKVPGVRFVL